MKSFICYFCITFNSMCNHRSVAKTAPSNRAIASIYSVYRMFLMMGCCIPSPRNISFSSGLSEVLCTITGMIDKTECVFIFLMSPIPLKEGILRSVTTRHKLPWWISKNFHASSPLVHHDLMRESAFGKGTQEEIIIIRLVFG